MIYNEHSAPDVQFSKIASFFGTVGQQITKAPLAAGLAAPTWMHLEEFRPAPPVLDVNPTSTARLGIFQFDPSPRGTQENANYIASRLRHATDATVVLPELFLSSYAVQPLFRPTETELREALLPLLDLSVTNRLTLVGSLASRSRSGQRNRATVMANGDIHLLYDKQRLFGDERSTLDPGENACDIHMMGNLAMSAQVCFDLTQPLHSGPAMDLGLDFLAVPSATSVDFLTHVARSRAIEAQCLTAICNRSGTESNGIRYAGKSAIYNGMGEALIEASEHEELAIIEVAEHIAAQRSLRAFMSGM